MDGIRKTVEPPPLQPRGIDGLIDLVDEVFAQAQKLVATGIELRRSPAGATILLCTAGRWHGIYTVGEKLVSPICSIFVVLADLSLGSDLPQTGRVIVRVNDALLDVTVSIQLQSTTPVTVALRHLQLYATNATG